MSVSMAQLATWPPSASSPSVYPWWRGGMSTSSAFVPVVVCLAAPDL